jgi:hypothetical protein
MSLSLTRPSTRFGLKESHWPCQPILQRLKSKAHRVFVETHSGIAPAIKNDIFAPTHKDQPKDDFEIFSGKTHTVATKSRPNNPSSSSSVASSRSPPASSSGLSSPSFAGVHPMLVDQLQEFEGRLNAQIQHGYYDEHARALLQSQGSYLAATPSSIVPVPHQVQQSPHSAAMYQQQQQVPSVPYTTAPMASLPPPARHVLAHESLPAPSRTYQQPATTLSHHQPAASYLPQQQQQQAVVGSAASQRQYYSPSGYHTTQQPVYPTDNFASQHFQQQQQQEQRRYFEQQLFHAHYAALDPASVDDPRLQEGWTTFMQSVGSPRAYVDD